jgi:small subunit ribosomal protein S11
MEELVKSIAPKSPGVLGVRSALPVDDANVSPEGKTVAKSQAQQREEYANMDEPFHFHVYAHRHNTHITVTKPDRNAIISVSSGQLGFRHAKRGTFDAAYQLAGYVFDKLHQGNWHNLITKMEVVLRGFGPGREATTKILLGSEGRLFRPKIVKVADATRLKIGGTRGRNPRRL